MKDIDIQRMVKGFREAYYGDLRKLKEYLEERKKKESIKFAPIFIEIIYEVDKLIDGIQSS